jgi:O-antigen ligase
MIRNVSLKALVILVLLFLTISIGAPWGTDLYYVNLLDYKVYLVALFLLVAMSFFYLTTFKKEFVKFQLSESQLFLLLFFVFSSFSFFWTNDQTLFIGKWLLYVFGFLSFYLATKLEPKDKYYIYLALGLVLASGLISMLGISQYLFEIPNKALLPYENIPAATFGNKNAANQFLVLSFPVIIFALVSKINRFQYVLVATVFIATLFYVYYATTKSAWIALFVEILITVFYLFFSRKYLAYKIFTSFKVSILVITTILFLLLDLSSVKSSFSPESQSKFDAVATSLSDRYQDSESSRKKIWNSAINIANKSPAIGHGLGSFAYELSVEGNFFRLKKVHNDILEMYVELGLIGISLFLLFFYYFIKDWISINKSNNKQEALFFNFLMIAFTGSFINMMFSWPYQAIHGVVLFGVFSALIITKANSKRIITYSLPTLFRAISMFLVILILVFSFSLTKLQIGNLSDFYYNSGMYGYKFNAMALSKYAKNISNQDIHLSKVADGYWKAGYHDRASEVYGIITKYNLNNVLALYRQFITALDQKNLDQAINFLKIMQSNNKLHPLTFRASVNFYRANKDMDKAKESYYFYKRYFDSLSRKDKRAYKALHHWSIILGLYKDTPILYKTYIENFSKEVYVENNMGNYYVYTQQYNKAVPHINYTLDDKLNIVKPEVLKVLLDKGLINL